MKTRIIDNDRHEPDPVAALNRNRLDAAGVFTVNLIGSPGCGKTSLIDALVQRLMPTIQVGVIACDITAQLDAERMTRYTEQVAQVNTGDGAMPQASDIRDALDCLDLHRIDLLLIENVGSPTGPARLDLGQNATAVMFSVAGGHDKAHKHSELVRIAQLVILNKIDLLPSVPFDLTVFRNDVMRVNTQAQLFEVSAIKDHGVESLAGLFRASVRTKGH